MRLLCTALACLVLFGCSKYDEGSFLSLRSKTKRLTGHWEIVNPPSSVSFLDFEDPAYLDNLSALTFHNIVWNFKEAGGFEFYASWEEKVSFISYLNLSEVEIIDTTFFAVNDDVAGVGSYSVTYGTMISVSEIIDTAYFVVNDEDLTGSWAFKNDKEAIRLSLNNNTALNDVEYLISALIPTGDFKINRLTNCELWIEKDGHELRLEKLE